MANAAAGIAPPAPYPRERLVLAATAFAAGLAVKLVGTALMDADLPAQWRLLAGMMLVSVPKLLLVATIVVLGKDGFVFLRDRILGSVGGPARSVSRPRYVLGLVMFWLPLAKVWAMPYLSIAFPDSVTSLERWNVLSDLMLVASVLVLGGDFWDKLRGLFVRAARAVLPAPAPGATAAYAGAAIVLLVAGQVGFLAIRPAVMASGLGEGAKVVLSLAFVLLPALGLVVAAMALGRVHAGTAQRGAAAISVARHRLGLALIVVPLAGEIVIDIAIGAYAPFQGRFKLLLDLMLLAGLFALGPGFWDKLRALFDHRATVDLAPQA